MPKLKDQERALAAHRAVEDRIRRWRGDKKLQEYRQELQQLPSRILVSGLGQTLAFYASKAGPTDSNTPQAAIGDELARFLTGGRLTTTVKLLNEVIAAETAAEAMAYRRQTREALAYAEWLKRYAAALIEKPRSAEDGAGVQ